MSREEALPTLPAWRLRPSVRRIVVRLAGVACPPPGGTGDLMGGDLMGGLVAEFEALLGALPRSARSLILGGLVAFDQGARLYPRAHGRRFVRLPDADADAYLRAVLAQRRGGLATSVQRIKGLVVMCYYELPEVKEQLGYRPDAYIAEVSRRRLTLYGPQIRAGEAALLGSGPELVDPAPSPGAPGAPGAPGDRP
jgi:hypothetical protein